MLELDSFFSLQIQVMIGPYENYFTNGPLHCGPYLSYIEAARVMMEGTHISLAAYWDDLLKHKDITIHSQIIECVLIDGKVETLGIKSEESRRLSMDS